ncbi:helix-turn-helix domain-containing protein [Phaeobacter inhibens]|uniref:AlbA family DNA-binding domain-containing protein n=1 Tax=Phaeobacter inhibens TaxID=221822 RepID=UPI0009EB69E8|nr:ATP-binding protein [Phaeobacter inhibens]WHP66900.1 ATP-binding protein [Phaeobacter inhibens]
MQLICKIRHLIETGKEGVYWDFKRQHHANKADLLHDILCLANADHDGERYIIFGVEDETKAPRALTCDQIRRTQADILSFFKGNQGKFAENCYPDLRLEKVTLEGNELDVLIISNSPKKPFYLLERIEGVRAHHIYTRILDTNTPKDRSASPGQIEQMWRARFGLDQPPLTRAKTFLADCDGWEFDTQDNGNGLWWYKVFPEFTIRVESSDLDCSQEWTRGEIVKNKNYSSLYSLFYHQTRLTRIHWVSFDDRKKSMVAPRWEPCLTGRFYYYERDSIEFAMQVFHAHHNGADHSKGLAAPTRAVDIPIASSNEVGAFLATQTTYKPYEVSTDPAEQYNLFLKNQRAFQKWRP